MVARNGLGSQMQLGIPADSDVLYNVCAHAAARGRQLHWSRLDREPLCHRHQWHRLVQAANQTPAFPLHPLYATADGGAIFTITPCLAGAYCAPTLGIFYTIDQNGNITSQTPDTGAVYSWTGNWYDPPPTEAAISSLPLPPLAVASTFWAFGLRGGGNPSATRSAVRHFDFELMWCAANLCKPNGARDVSFVPILLR